MSSSVRVSNLPKQTDQDTIYTLFLSFGNILNFQMANNHIDIQFQDIEDASAAIENMRGFELYDKYLEVSRIGEFNVVDTLHKNKPLWNQEEDSGKDI